MTGPDKRDIIKKEEILKAVVITDLFDSKYVPLKNSGPVVTWPIGTVPIIRLCLLSLYLHSQIKHILLVTRTIDRVSIERVIAADLILSSGDVIIQYVEIAGSSCVGDVLRELYARRLIDSDFLLLDKLCTSTVDFSSLSRQFKTEQKKNRNLIGAVCVARSSSTNKACVQLPTVA